MDTQAATGNRKISAKRIGWFLAALCFNLSLIFGLALATYFSRPYALGYDFYQTNHPRFHFLIYYSIHYFIPLTGLVILLLLVGNSFFFRKLFSTEKLKTYALLLFATAVAFLLVEITLRIMGYSSGKLPSGKWYTDSDKIHELLGFETDSLGIVKVNSIVTKEIDSLYQHRLIKPFDYWEKCGRVGELYVLAEDYINPPDNAFNRKINQLKRQKTLSDIDSALLQYSRSPINAEGFRSIAFKKYNTPATKVLLLGDSFTWGHSTTNKTNSFADELLAKGYVVYNTGITATDPAQYLAVAKKYIPKLRPDAVIVNFYMGNDVVQFKRTPEPYQPLFYYTDVGVLMACPQGVYLNSLQEAHRFTRQWLYIPQNKNPVNRVCALTATGTFLWKVLSYFGLVDARHREFDHYFKESDAIYSEGSVFSDIQEISTLCKQHESRFILSVFPDIDRLGRWVKPTDVPGLFDGITYQMMDFEKEDYDLSNNHLNDKGSERYARFLDSLLQNRLPFE